MSNFQPYNDSPEKIKQEGQQITLSLTKTGPTTAQIYWDLPRPVTGCDGLAYNGIVITVGSEAAKPADAPKDGTTYTADPTFDGDLHVGDTIQNNYVVGALYGDTTTTSITVTGLQPNVAYYVNGYAVDAQNRYHTEGVHAYSQPWGGDEREALPGYQEVQIGYEEPKDNFDILRVGCATGVQLSAPTCLDENGSYFFDVKTNACGTANNCVPVRITVSGATSQTYGDLINSINSEFVNLCGHPEMATPPNIGCHVMDVVNCSLGIWNGSSYDTQDVLCQTTDPNIPLPNMFWYNPETNILQQYDGAIWNTIDYISYQKDPNDLDTSDYWFNGTIGRRWEGATWCDRVTYVQTTDPALAVTPVTGTYWFNPSTGVMYSWSESCSKWVEVDVIYSPVNPSNDTDGLFWFDVDDNKLYIRNASTWSEYSLRYEITNTAPTIPTDGTAWVDVDNDKVYVYNSAASPLWEDEDAIFYHVDPSNRLSCQLWWNSTTDELNIWDNVNLQWVQVNQFLQTEIDPAAEPNLDPQTLWYSPNTETMLYWDGSEWTSINVIYYDSDPTVRTADDVWFNTTTSTWYQWSGSPLAWVEIDVFEYKEQPGMISLGTYWYNSSGPSLALWNGVGWMGVLFQTSSCEPDEGYTYYNSTDGVVYEWNGTSWIIDDMPAMVQLNDDGNMLFTTGTTGSESFIELLGNNLFGALCEDVFICDPVIGSDNIPGVQNYAVMGIGTDGSTDERRKLVKDLQNRLGAPMVNVELTKENYDTAIRLALEELRRRSASAYKRGFFFLNLEPGVQKYELSNQTAGFHKITEVMAAYRIQSSFLGVATGQGAYGQAMLQHLYQMGSFDLVSYHIVSDYVELMNHLFAAYLVFNWDEDTRMLHLFQTVGGDEKVLLDVMTERTEQSLMRDRFTKTWIERYALAQCQLMLAEPRGKYGSLPGAGGGVSLNAQELTLKAEANLEWCEEEINNYISNEIETVGMGGDFILG